MGTIIYNISCNVGCTDVGGNFLFASLPPLPPFLLPLLLSLPPLLLSLPPLLLSLPPLLLLFSFPFLLFSFPLPPGLSAREANGGAAHENICIRG